MRSFARCPWPTLAVLLWTLPACGTATPESGFESRLAPTELKSNSKVRSNFQQRRDGPQVRVTAPNGEPLAGVEVWLVDPGAIRPESAVIATRTLGDWVMASRAVAAEVVPTDAGGIAAFAAPQEAGFLVAAARGSLFGLVERTEPLGRREQVLLQMLDRPSYPVSVRAANGLPAAGVALTLAAPEPASPDRPFALPSTAITDADGFATLYEPPAAAKRLLEGLDQIPERIALVRLPVEGLTPASLRTGGERTEIILPPLETIEVRCRHAAFSEGHWAGLIQVFPMKDGSRSTRTLAHSFDRGRLILPHASTGQDLRIVAVISEAAAPDRFIGTLTLESRGALEPTLKAGIRSLELPLDTGLLVTGRCLDGQGKALAGETIDLFVVGDASTSWTQVTDREGRFRWLLMRPGKPLARVVLGARATRSAGDLRATQRLGEVEAGQVVDLGVLTLE